MKWEPVEKEVISADTRLLWRRRIEMKKAESISPQKGHPVCVPPRTAAAQTSTGSQSTQIRIVAYCFYSTGSEEANEVRMGMETCTAVVLMGWGTQSSPVTRHVSERRAMHSAVYTHLCC